MEDYFTKNTKFPKIIAKTSTNETLKENFLKIIFEQNPINKLIIFLLKKIIFF